MDSHTIVLGGFIVSLALFSLGVYKLQPVYHILGNDPIDIRDLHGRTGPVEIEGTAKPVEGNTVLAPLTQTECLAYTYEVEEYITAGDNSRWVARDVGMGGVDFVVEDRSGRVPVDPQGCDLRLEAYTVTISPGEEVPDRLKRFVEAAKNTDGPDPEHLNVGLSDIISRSYAHKDAFGDGISEIDPNSRYRFTERRLDVGESVYVYGEAKPDRSTEWGSKRVDARIADGPEASLFVISDTDERGTAWLYSIPGVALLVGAVLSLILTGILVITA